MQTTDTSNFFRTETELAKDEARKLKARRTKDLGAPLELPGKILSFKVRGSEVWTAESGHVVRRLSLESGKTLQLYKGHNGPVTCLAFHEPDVLFTGSWDKSIKAWRTSDKSLLSSTPAHSDFVKALLVIPSLALVVSGSSDKVIRFWDLSSDLFQQLVQLGSISAHTRPVEALAFQPRDETSGILFTADTMGVIKVWELEREYGDTPRCRAKLTTELYSHRTGVNDLWVGNGVVWSASNDESVVIQPFPLSPPTGVPLKTYTIAHPNAVRALLPVSLTSLAEPYLISASGDAIRLYAYDFAAPEDSPELLGEIDAHWHDVTALGLWMQVVERDGNTRTEAWILSASLDATLRRWRLEGILSYMPNDGKTREPQVKVLDIPPPSTLTEEEERELDELM
ncbi:WD40-repeat-containing domain protein, partial [Gautieria morchelliformis]